MLTPVGMTALETACGIPLGLEEGCVSPVREKAAPPSCALERALLPAVRSPPCLVSFSGGRDSSLVLWAAVAAAGRERLPEPIPFTLRFPHAAATEESSWQELMVTHLGLNDWVRTELSDELDFVGPMARGLLIRQGPLYPPNAHLIAPMLADGAGGSIVSGLGGDEVFGLWSRRRLADVAARRARVSWRDMARVAGELAPPGIRRSVLRRRRTSQPIPWLRDHAQAAVEETQLSELARAPARWDQHVADACRHKSITFAVRDCRRIATEGGVAFHAPLVDPDFTASLARAGGWRGFGGQSATLKALFGGALPIQLLSRRDKATFNAVFFTEETRRIARAWSGHGLDESIVDPEALRRSWLDPRGDYRSAMLLQSAWLHDHEEHRC